MCAAPPQLGGAATRLELPAEPPVPRRWRRLAFVPNAAGEVALPGGFPDGDRLSSRAVLRPPTGHDEVWLFESSACSPAARVTGLLDRLLVGLGDDDAQSALRAANLEALHAGDQDVLMLALYRLVLGETIQAVGRCPRADCAKPFDLLFPASSVPTRSGRPEEDPFLLETPRGLATASGPRQILLRLPKVADRRAIADAAEPVSVLRERCVLAVDGRTPQSEEVSQWPEPLLAWLDEELVARSPGLPPTLATTCPECGRATQLAFDPASLVLSALAGSAARLWREVHVLAWSYHWSEAEILGLTRQRRITYLGLIRAEVEGG